MCACAYVCMYVCIYVCKLLYSVCEYVCELVLVIFDVCFHVSLYVCMFFLGVYLQEFWLLRHGHASFTVIAVVLVLLVVVGIEIPPREGWAHRGASHDGIEFVERKVHLPI